MSDIALVTGASGFVGSAVALALSRRGFQVRAALRATSPRLALDSVSCEIVEADMKDEAAMLRAMAGARYVFHVAADYRLWARDPGEIVRNNVEGTNAVMRAARAAGIEKIVYTSSVATLKPPRDGAADETARATFETAIGAYKKSKVAAERLVERMVREENLPAVLVSPSTPIGPRDVRPTPTGRMIVEAAVGRIPAFVETGLNLVHVDDVAEGHVAALAKGRIGENYILGGENVGLKDILGLIAGLTGRKAPTIKLPRLPLFPLAYATEAMARFTGKEPLMTVDGLSMAKYRMFFSSAKAIRELGYTTRGVAPALEDAVAWFGAHGYLK